MEAALFSWASTMRNILLYRHGLSRLVEAEREGKGGGEEGREEEERRGEEGQSPMHTQRNPPTSPFTAGRGCG